MPKDLEQLQEKTLNNIEQFLEERDCLQQKIANNIENKLAEEQKLYFLNIQMLTFNKNIERIVNFKNQKIVLL